MALSLVGKEGVGKSKYIATALPPQLKNYFAMNRLTNYDNALRVLSRNIFVVVDEFDKQTLQEQRNAKLLLSMDEGEMRDLWEKSMSTMKRRATVALTCNDPDFLDPSDENTRYLVSHMLPPRQGIRQYSEDCMAFPKDLFIRECFHIARESPEECVFTPEDIELIKEINLGKTRSLPESELVSTMLIPSKKGADGAVFHTNADIRLRLERRLPTKRRLSAKMIGGSCQNKGLRKQGSPTPVRAGK